MSRAFTHKDQPGLGRALPEDEMGPALVQLASLTLADAVPQILE
jgi:hypothetical protein